jgi:hypothetical protein
MLSTSHARTSSSWPIGSMGRPESASGAPSRAVQASGRVSLARETTGKVCAQRNQRVRNPSAGVHRVLERLTTRRRLAGLLAFRLFQWSRESGSAGHREAWRRGSGDPTAASPPPSASPRRLLHSPRPPPHPPPASSRAPLLIPLPTPHPASPLAPLPTPHPSPSPSASTRPSSLPLNAPPTLRSASHHTVSPVVTLNTPYTA